MDKHRSRQRRIAPANAVVVLVVISAIASLIFASAPDLLFKIAHEGSSGGHILLYASAIIVTIVAIGVVISAFRLLVARSQERRDELSLLREIATIQGELTSRNDHIRTVDAARSDEVRDQKLRNYLTSHWSEIVGVEPGSLGAGYFVLSEFARNLGHERTATWYRRQFETSLLTESGSTPYSKQFEVSSTRKKLDTVRRYYRRRLENCKRHRQRQGEAVAHCALAHVAFAEGDLQQAKQDYATCLAIWRNLSNRVEQIPCLFQLARVAEAVQDYGIAEQLYQEGLQLARPTENGLEIAAFLLMLGQVLVVTSQLPQDSSGSKMKRLQRQRRQLEGRAMLTEAATLYKSASPAHLRHVRTVARRLGVRVGR